jgi:hypothetical protein
VYQLLASISTHDLALRQTPAFAVSFIIASLFYKFGSFALECVAFLATWFVIDAGIQLINRMRGRTQDRPPGPQA